MSNLSDSALDRLLFPGESSEDNDNSEDDGEEDSPDSDSPDGENPEPSTPSPSDDDDDSENVVIPRADTAWVIDEDMTGQDKERSINWIVHKIPAFSAGRTIEAAKAGKGKKNRVSNLYLLVRELDRNDPNRGYYCHPFGTCSEDGYKPVQHLDTLGQIQELINQGSNVVRLPSKLHAWGHEVVLRYQLTNVNRKITIADLFAQIKGRNFPVGKPAEGPAQPSRFEGRTRGLDIFGNREGREGYAANPTEDPKQLIEILGNLSEQKAGNADSLARNTWVIDAMFPGPSMDGSPLDEDPEIANLQRSFTILCHNYSGGTPKVFWKVPGNHLVELAPRRVRGMVVHHELNIRHDHTGAGSVSYALVCYLSHSADRTSTSKMHCLGASLSDRKIHKGRGKKDIGVGESGWSEAIGQVTESARALQDSLSDLLIKADQTPMTEEIAKIFEEYGFTIPKEEEEKRPGQRGGVKKSDKFKLSGSALDVLLDAFSPKRKGATQNGQPRWGVWAECLSNAGIRALQEVTKIKVTTGR